MADKSGFATRVVIHQRSLRGSGDDDLLQKIATVYIGSEEFRVYAPPAAAGESADWLDHVSVHSLDVEDPGAEVDVPDSDAQLVIKATRDALESVHGEQHAPGHHNYYHVRLQLSEESDLETKFDLSREELEERVLEPYRNLRPIVLGGRTILPANLERIEVYEASRPSSEFKAYTKELARQPGHDWYQGESDVRDVTDEQITTSAVSALPQKSDAIDLVCLRFHTVATQLRDRRENRPTLDVADEYDVQDLLHALLRIFFDDVRPEEWVPSYAGKSARMDFLLPATETVIEAKRTRPGLNAKELGDQLIVDIVRYKTHPLCKKLVCFVYDPEGRITNPRGIEHDLTKNDSTFQVKVIIAPTW